MAVLACVGVDVGASAPQLQPFPEGLADFGRQRAFLGEPDGSVWCVRLSDGALVWRAPECGYPAGSMADSLVCCRLGETLTVTLLEVETGKALSRSAPLEPPVQGPVRFSAYERQGQLEIGWAGPRATGRLSLEPGSLRLRAQGPLPQELLPPAPVTSVTHDSVDYVLDTPSGRGDLTPTLVAWVRPGVLWAVPLCPRHVP